MCIRIIYILYIIDHDVYVSFRVWRSLPPKPRSECPHSEYARFKVLNITDVLTL